MAIRVNDPAYPNLPDEKSVILGDKHGRLVVHPWLRGYGPYGRNDSRVSLTMGNLKKDGTPKNNEDDADDWLIHIFDRADFVEALLAVFPELVHR